ncbi:MAG: ester cyclase [Egibacteraceae bacterium]
MRGTHQGTWRGLPPTGRRASFPLCAVHTFTDADDLAGERIFYDGSTLLTQLGVFRDPDGPAGRIMTLLNHAITGGPGHPAPASRENARPRRPLMPGVPGLPLSLPWAVAARPPPPRS